MMINRWFKDKNGLAMGIMMSFVAICSAVLSPVVASIIASNGWRMGYIVQIGRASCRERVSSPV